MLAVIRIRGETGIRPQAAKTTSLRTIFAISPTALPTPWGAGLIVTTTEPDLPTTRNGRLCALPQPHSHDPQPLLISRMLSFALLIAFLIAGAASLDFPLPTPMKGTAKMKVNPALNLTTPIYVGSVANVSSDKN